MILYEEILRDFSKERVRYILVGGIALNLLGYMRATMDLDLLVEMSDENLKKIVKIMKKRGYVVRQPVDPMGIAEEKTRRSWIREKHMKAFNFYKDKELKEVDLIIESPVTFEQAVKKVERIRVGDLTLPVISINHLIKMKQKAGRPDDLRDVEVLLEMEKGKRQLQRKKGL